MDYSQTYILIGLLCAAPFIGSFLGVVITRSISGGSILWGRSQCDVCSHPLSPADLVPVFSWLVSCRRCKYCSARLGWFYPVIELVALIPVIWSAIYMNGWLLIMSSVLGWILICLAWIDWRTYRLPNGLTGTLIFLGLLCAYWFDRDDWWAHLAGVVIGFVCFALVALGYRALRKRDGLGLGDAKLLAGLGAWVGWTGIPTTVIFSAAIALLFFSVRAACKRCSVTDALPFGPFLAAAGWLVWMYGSIEIS